MIQLPNIEFNDLQKYIQDHFDELLNDAIEEFNNSNTYSKELEDRFRQLRPYDHDVVTDYLDKIEQMKP